MILDKLSPKDVMIPAVSCTDSRPSPTFGDKGRVLYLGIGLYYTSSPSNGKSFFQIVEDYNLIGLWRGDQNYYCRIFILTFLIWYSRLQCDVEALLTIWVATVEGKRKRIEEIKMLSSSTLISQVINPGQCSVLDQIKLELL